MFRWLTRARAIVCCCAVVSTVVAPAWAEPADFALDPRHTSITFFVHHLGYADLAGMFLQSEGTFRFDEDSQQLSDLRVVVKTASVFTNDDERDGHLRSVDFLNTDEFPEMIFEGTTAEPLGEDSGRITGDLTLLGVTRPMTLEATLNKAGPYPFGDEHYAIGINATGTFKRSDFGMTYGADNGWVGDEIRIVLGFEAIRQE